MVSRREALVKETRSKKRQMYMTKTRYRNTKNRQIMKSVQIAYVVKVGPKTFYGIKAARPVHLLSVAPLAIRPK